MFKRLTLACCLGLALLLSPLSGWAQVQQEPLPPQGPPGAARRDMRPGAFGSVVSVGVDRFEVKGQDEKKITVLVSEQTQYRQGQKEIQLEDLKVGDRVMVQGEFNSNKELNAIMVRRVTDDDMRRFQAMGERTGGEITAIQNEQIKIRNPFQGEKTIVVNDQTVFLKEGEPITLKDLKVGDRIFATGKEEKGVFVASRVMTGMPGQRGGRMRGGGMPPGPPPTGQPEPAPQQ